MAIAALYPSTKPSLLLDFANTKTLDPRITFSRASTATYYDGKTFAKAEENLLSYSQEFDNAGWAKVNSTVTANATAAPDGATTADKLVASATAAAHGVYIGSSGFQNGTTYTLSVYVKSAEYTKFYISEGNSGRFYCSFDIGAGTAGTPGGTYTNKSASIVAVANGFYRCSITFTSTETATRAPEFGGYPDTGATLDQYGAQYTGDGTSGIYIWGAQLEQRSSATAYTPTTSQPITNYIPVLQTAASGVARFDHNPTTGESLGLLIEEQRTNLLLRSQEFDDAAWVKSSAAVSANQVVAPDGTLSADLIQEAAIAGVHYVRFGSVSLTSGATYTASVYVKAKERSSVNLVSYNGASDTISVFNLNSYTVTSGSGSIVHIGNGWCKVSQQFTQTTTGANTFAVQIHLNNGSGNNYTGDGYSGIYIWGAQLEADSFPTSYIPTTTAQVTRSADAASMTGSNFSSWYRQDEGTIFIENNYNYGSGLASSGRAALQISDGTNSNRHLIYNGSAHANRYYVAVGGTGLVALTVATVTSSFVKSSAAYRVNDFAHSLNGSVPTTDTDGLLPVVNRIDIGCSLGSSAYLNSTIKKIAYYPSRLSNTVIQALTT
jgi:hypothetical protein